MRALKKAGKIVLMLISVGCFFITVSFIKNKKIARPTLMNAGYPRAFFFRRSEDLITAGYENWEKTFNRLGGIMGKTLNEELVNRKISLPFFQKFKQNNPTQAVFLHYNGNARDPLDGEIFFPGYWLYYEGTPLLQNIDNGSQQATLNWREQLISI